VVQCQAEKEEEEEEGESEEKVFSESTQAVGDMGSFPLKKAIHLRIPCLSLLVRSISPIPIIQTTTLGRQAAAAFSFLFLFYWILFF